MQPQEFKIMHNKLCIVFDKKNKQSSTIVSKFKQEMIEKKLNNYIKIIYINLQNEFDIEKFLDKNHIEKIYAFDCDEKFFDMINSKEIEVVDMNTLMVVDTLSSIPSEKLRPKHYINLLKYVKQDYVDFLGFDKSIYYYANSINIIKNYDSVISIIENDNFYVNFEEAKKQFVKNITLKTKLALNMHIDQLEYNEMKMNKFKKQLDERTLICDNLKKLTKQDISYSIKHNSCLKLVPMMRKIVVAFDLNNEKEKQIVEGIKSTLIHEKLNKYIKIAEVDSNDEKCFEGFFNKNYSLLAKGYLLNGKISEFHSKNKIEVVNTTNDSVQYIVNSIKKHYVNFLRSSTESFYFSNANVFKDASYIFSFIRDNVHYDDFESIKSILVKHENKLIQALTNKVKLCNGNVQAYKISMESFDGVDKANEFKEKDCVIGNKLIALLKKDKTKF